MNPPGSRGSNSRVAARALNPLPDIGAAFAPHCKANRIVRSKEQNISPLSGNPSHELYRGGEYASTLPCSMSVRSSRDNFPQVGYSILSVIKKQTIKSSRIPHQYHSTIYVNLFLSEFYFVGKEKTKRNKKNSTQLTQRIILKSNYNRF